jgi:hypothetical protein
MTPATNYEMVSASEPNELSLAVTDHMIDGWYPLGRPFVHGDRYFQAMVRDRQVEKRLQTTTGDS